MQSVKRITQNKIDQAVDVALSDYRDGVNSIQEFRDGKLSLPHLPNQTFKVRVFTNALSELVRIIQEVNEHFGVLELVQGNGYESRLTKRDGGYTDGTLYFKKSESMVKEDLKLVAKIAEASLRDEIASYNLNLLASDEAELKAIELEEVKEQQKLRQTALDRVTRAERKKELQKKLVMTT